MTTVASPAIIFNRNPEDGKINHLVDPVLDDLFKIRLRGFGRVVLYRKPNDEVGDFTFKTLNNKLHRTAAQQGFYLTIPVIVNYDNALSTEQIQECIDDIMMCDKGRVYLINLNKDGTYIIDLLLARNAQYERFGDIVQTSKKPFTFSE